MPVTTASGEEAVVTAWFVDEGEACTEGQLIAEVLAEKIAAEVEAPSAGYVVDRVALGDPISQGSPICRITESPKQPVATSADGPTADSTILPPQVIASPAAKRVAKEFGVDLAAIPGSGPGNRITESDVRGAAETPRAAASGMRTVIARNMRRSHAETAAVTLHSTVGLGTEKPSEVTATIVRVVAEVLSDHPHLNGHREGDQFITAAVTHVALAIQTDEGLVAPVVRNPVSRSTEDIADEIRDLVERASARTLTAEDFEGATFTVTNLGSYGIDGFTPLINLPQVAILGVGALRQVPVVDESGSVATGYQVVLSLTFDHAFVDGAPAAAFLHQIGETLAG